MEMRAGIEPTHKGFAVLDRSFNQLVKWGFPSIRCPNWFSNRLYPIGLSLGPSGSAPERPEPRQC
jgi:hypothetical protein